MTLSLLLKILSSFLECSHEDKDCLHDKQTISFSHKRGVVSFNVYKVVRYSSVSLSPTLDKNEKVEQYIRKKTCKPNALRFWVGGSFIPLYGLALASFFEISPVSPLGFSQQVVSKPMVFGLGQVQFNPVSKVFLMKISSKHIREWRHLQPKTLRHWSCESSFLYVAQLSHSYSMWT